MSPSSSDCKPCTYSRCTGTMHVSANARRGWRRGASSVPSRSTYPVLQEESGWVCDLHARHFGAIVRADVRILAR